MLLFDGNPTNEMIVRLALSGLDGQIPISDQWPLAKGPQLLALDVVGHQASVWAAQVEEEGRSTEATVCLNREDGQWSAHAVNREDGFSQRTRSDPASPLHAWSFQISFRDLEPKGVAVVWGRASAGIYQVASGFGFAEPRIRAIQNTTGCFLIVQEVDQSQAATLRTIRDMRDDAGEPILRAWSRDGSVIDLGGGFQVRRNEKLSS